MIEIIVTFVGVVMSVGYYPQAYKIMKNKSAGDISIPMYLIMSVGTLTWTLYGIYLNDLVIIISFAIGIIGSWSVLGLTFYYNNKNNQKNRPNSSSS